MRPVSLSIGMLRALCAAARHDEIHCIDGADAVGEMDSACADESREILDNICSVLSCRYGDIEGIEPIDQGLTNSSLRFECAGESYVYRHPGVGTDEIIDRSSEAFSQSVAKRLGIDETFVHEDPQRGWKISRFVPDCVEFDYHNRDHVERGLELVRRLHESGERSAWTFDVYAKAEEIVGMLHEESRRAFGDFDELRTSIAALYEFVCDDGVEPVLCHNDFYAPNFLVGDGFMYLIDWEYSAMSDYASDLGTFICCSDYDVEQADEAIALYFGREPSSRERRHCFAYVAISGYYWFVWALYKEETGDSVGDWLGLWHRYAFEYAQRALGLYKRRRAWS